ncbi:MAG: DUF4111 domain-containing protein [Blastochloris sp.]|nr:DUF4111 domain-containing protein [Blastochloris sp.]
MIDLPSLLNDLKGDERNVILTPARMWVTLATGEIVPKDTVAQWISHHVPASLSPVVELARSAYLGEREDDWSGCEESVDRFVEHAVGAIKTL